MRTWLGKEPGLTHLNKSWVVGTQREAGKLGMGLSSLVGCSRVEATVSRSSPCSKTSCTWETREPVGGFLVNFLAALYSCCFSVVIRELQFDKDSLDLFQTEIPYVSILAF